MKIKSILYCPNCAEKLNAKHTPKAKGQMARLYWRCKNCGISILKQMRIDEEKEWSASQ